MTENMVEAGVETKAAREAALALVSEAALELRELADQLAETQKRLADNAAAPFPGT